MTHSRKFFHASFLRSRTMVDHPTASWDAMQDGKVFYRRQQVYSISTKLPRLDDFVVAGCKYGGPLGMVCSGVSQLRLLTHT